MADKFKVSLITLLQQTDELHHNGFVDREYYLDSDEKENPIVLSSPQEDGSVLHMHFPPQDVVYDIRDGMRIKDVDGKEQHFLAFCLQPLSLENVSMNSAEDAPIEIVEGYDEFKGVVPRWNNYPSQE